MSHPRPDWVWLVCAECKHRAAIKIHDLEAKAGFKASLEVLARRLRCKECDHRGAMTYTPSWIDTKVGWEKFPVAAEERAI